MGFSCNFKTHLISGRGAGTRDHGDVGDLDRQVVVVDERPRPFHLASLEAVLKRPQVRISEQAAEQVTRSGVAVVVGVAVGVAVRVYVGVRVLGATVVVAGLVLDLRMSGRGRAVSGAVPLNHKVGDAQHSRVEHQISPTGLGRPLGAGGVRPQGLAKFSVKTIHGWRQVRSQGDKVSGALLDTTRRGGHLALT